MTNVGTITGIVGMLTGIVGEPWDSSRTANPAKTKYFKVREAVGLPGTGLSYTEVHRTHQEALGEIQPTAVPDVMPKGRAWRGWVWIGLLLLSVVAWLITRGQ
jgi:hypothetical protein